MEIKGKSQKECIKVFRARAKNKPGRYDLLAYAFLRERKYIELERKINEDRFSEQNRNSFFVTLSSNIAFCIDLAIGDKRLQFDEHMELQQNITNWIQEKYAK